MNITLVSNYVAVVSFKTTTYIRITVDLNYLTTIRW